MEFLETCVPLKRVRNSFMNEMEEVFLFRVDQKHFCEYPSTEKKMFVVLMSFYQVYTFLSYFNSILLVKHISLILVFVLSCLLIDPLVEITTSLSGFSILSTRNIMSYYYHYYYYYHRYLRKNFKTIGTSY